MNQEHHERLDRATRARLAKLASQPVDCSRVQAHLAGVLKASAPNPRRLWARSALAFAATIVFAIGLFLVWSGTAGGPVVASPTMLNQVHRDLLAGGIGVVPVQPGENIDIVVSKRWRSAPDMPELSGQPVVSCCLKPIDGSKLVGVLIQGKTGLMTMVVADEKKVRTPSGRSVVHAGRTYIVHEMGGVNMVMIARDGRWMCLMGEVPTQELLEAASDVTF